MDEKLTNSQKDAIKKMRGRKGEDLACNYLVSRGYRIIDRNFRSKGGEIDLIGVKGRKISFIEVKARSSTDYGMPRDAVDYRKRRRLLNTAQFYLKIHPGFDGWDCSMDIVEILYLDSGTYIRHTPGAFSLGR